MPLLPWATILRLLRDFVMLAQLYWFSNVRLCLLVGSDVTEVCIPPHGLSWTASTLLLTYDYHHHSVGHLFLIFKITSCPKVFHSFLSSRCKLVSGLPHSCLLYGLFAVVSQGWHALSLPILCLPGSFFWTSAGIRVELTPETRSHPRLFPALWPACNVTFMHTLFGVSFSLLLSCNTSLIQVLVTSWMKGTYWKLLNFTVTPILPLMFCLIDF